MQATQAPRQSNSQNSKISFGYVHSQAKIFLISYPPFENSTTPIAILLIHNSRDFFMICKFIDKYILHEKTSEKISPHCETDNVRLSQLFFLFPFFLFSQIGDRVFVNGNKLGTLQFCGATEFAGKVIHPMYSKH